MTPSAATRRSAPGPRTAARRGRRCNAVVPHVGAATTARALAAGLWRLRHAVGHDGPAIHNICKCNGNKTWSDVVGGRSQCAKKHGGILDLEKMEGTCVCVELPYGWSWMEKATKWDLLLLHASSYRHNLHDPHCKFPPHPHSVHHARRRATPARAGTAVLELEEEVVLRRKKKLERFLRKAAEEKEQLKAERKHRRQLEAANARLIREVAAAKASARQLARRYEMEKKARELMEEACSELTREVEEEQAEVELLRRMREEMEEERRMLQMAEVWREERVQMKLSDARIALEHKYSQLNTLQAEMEAFLGRHWSSVVRFRNVDVAEEEEFSHPNPQHQRRQRQSSSSPASNVDDSVSPATDIFLEKQLDAAASSSSASVGVGTGTGTSCSSDHQSAARPSDVSFCDSGTAEVHLHPGATASSWRSGSGSANKNTALIRRLWRSAISESSRKKKKKKGAASGSGNGWTPSSDERSALPVAAEQCSSSAAGSSLKPQTTVVQAGDGLPRARGGGFAKQSLKEKLMEARMDDHKDKPCNAPLRQNI